MQPRRFGPGHPLKYYPLQQYLTAQAGDQLGMSFADIEAIIGAPLPPSTWRGTWWANHAGYPQAQAWLTAGWRVAAVNFAWRTVTFVRQGEPEMP